MSREPRVGTGPGRLARIDERALPALAGGLRGMGTAARSTGRFTGPVGRWISRFSRRQPTVVAAVLTVAAAGVLWAATGGNHPKSVRPTVASVAPALSSSQLGPSAGTTVQSYLSDAAVADQQIAGLPSTQRLSALVDLTGYLTPQVISTLLAAEPHVQIQLGYARVAPPVNGAIHVLTVGIGGALSSQLAQDRTVAQQTLSRYALALEARAEHPRRAKLNQLVTTQLPQVPAARVDAKGLGPTCACVFALVVAGPVGELEQIAGLSDVRAMDPAPPGTAATDLTVLPLEPQVTGTVAPLQFALN